MWYAQRSFRAAWSAHTYAYTQDKHNNHKHKWTNFRYKRAFIFSNIITLMAIGHNTKCTKVNISILKIMNTIFCCVAAKLRALLWCVAAKNCGWRNDAWDCRCVIKMWSLCSASIFCVWVFLLFVFSCTFVLAGWSVFHFWFFAGWAKHSKVTCCCEV